MPEKKMDRLPDIRDVRDLAGKRILLRAGLNVPVADGKVQNAFRIARAMPAIEHLVAHGARVILVSHIGREADETLAPVYEYMRALLPTLRFCKDVTGDLVRRACAELTDGDVVMLENLRSVAGETDNDAAFAAELASYADLYVNDAFAASHRVHASIVGVPALLPAYFGSNFIAEYAALSGARAPESPSLFILGGAKFETKLPLALQSLDNYDSVFIGGALAHDIWRAKGYEIGTSVHSDIDLSESPLVGAANLLLPIDVVVEQNGTTRVCAPEEVQIDEMILDAGPKTVELIAARAAEARAILWNGPLGNYERGFKTATEEVARAVARSDAHSVVGGGDTIASIESLCLSEHFGFLSTAGGAMLTFLETGTLPALDAVRAQHQKR